MVEATMATTKGFFAHRLKELRGAAELSQAQLADRAGISVAAVRQFEYGRREPAYETLVKLADGLGVSLAAFHPASALPGGSGEVKKPRKRKGK